MNRPVQTAAAALAVSLVLLVAGCGDDDDNTADQEPTPTPVATVEATPSAEASPSAGPSADAEDGETVTINLVGGKPTEKVGPNITVAKGDKLTLVITSDQAQEIHVHGLDIYIKVPAGETVTRTLTVDLAAGSYEVEVHETEILLFNLQVK